MKMKTSMSIMAAALASAAVCAPAWADRHDDHHEHGEKDRGGDMHEHGPGDMHEHGPGDMHGHGPGDMHPGEMAPNGASPADRWQKEEEGRREARETAMKDKEHWDTGRPERAMAHRAAIEQTWGETLRSPEAKAELSLHADRMARLNRVLDLSVSNAALHERAKKDLDEEIARDAKVLEGFRSRAGAR